jgi:hypothetical protein
MSDNDDPKTPPAPFEPGHEPVGLGGLPPFIKRVSPGKLTGGRALGRAAGGGVLGSTPGRKQVPSLWEFLEMGSPRLALGRAMGIPFAPWMVSINALFQTTSPSVVPNVGADTKFPQDFWIESAIARVTSQQTPTNQFDTMSDFFQNYQNGIECTLYVQGAPRFGIIEIYTPLSTAFDMTQPEWLGDWVATYDQNLEMSFQTVFALPEDALPLQVTCSFRCKGPVGEMFSRMTNDEAFHRLHRDFGIECSEAYIDWKCR